MATKRETMTVAPKDVGSAPAAMVVGDESGEEIATTLSDEHFKDLLTTQGWTLHHVVALKPPDPQSGRVGDSIAGRYLGPGEPIALPMNPGTGEIPEPIKTWTINPLRRDGQPDERVVLTVVGSYNINRAFARLPIGDYIGIRHMGKIQRPGQPRQLNTYAILTRASKDMAPAKELPAGESDNS